jgi:hypothetical protein
MNRYTVACKITTHNTKAHYIIASHSVFISYVPLNLLKT